METILHKLAAKLVENQQTLVTAESCTGGLIAALCTELPGSSIWFERGFVTYSNASKEDVLGVDAEIIRQYGAVSREVAEAMALGALKHSKAAWSLSVTGIAGPDGGSAEKPVGTVYFAFAGVPNILQSEKHFFSDMNRREIRKAACKTALSGMFTCLVTH